MYLRLLTDQNIKNYEFLFPEALRTRPRTLGVICLSDEETALGAALVLPKDEESTLEIQWLYVLPEYREKGAGTLMLQGILDMARAGGLTLLDAYFWGDDPDALDLPGSDDPEEDESWPMEEEPDSEEKALTEDDEPAASVEEESESWPVADDEDERPELWFLDPAFEETIRPEEDEGFSPEKLSDAEILEHFLLKNGFLMMPEYPIYSLTISDIITSDFVKAHGNSIHRKGLSGYEIVSFDILSKEDLVDVQRLIVKKGFKDFTELCTEKISFVCFRGDTPAGCILCSDDPDEKTITIMLLINFTTDPLCAAKLIASAGGFVMKNYQEEYRITFAAVNEGAVKLLKSFLGDQKECAPEGYTLRAVLEST